MQRRHRPEYAAQLRCGTLCRIGGDTPASSSVYSPMQDAIIWGAFDGNNPVWPRISDPFVPTSVMLETAVAAGCAIRLRSHAKPMNRCGAAWMRLRISKRPSRQRARMKASLYWTGAVRNRSTHARWRPTTYVVGAKTRTLHLIVGAQSPYEVISGRGADG